MPRSKRSHHTVLFKVSLSLSNLPLCLRFSCLHQGIPGVNVGGVSRDRAGPVAPQGTNDSLIISRSSSDKKQTAAASLRHGATTCSLVPRTGNCRSSHTVWRIRQRASNGVETLGCPPRQASSNIQQKNCNALLVATEHLITTNARSRRK